ncbi:hypothetical protein [Pseudoalteromonas lipolytica]|uniref:Uncharacterized protein n=1 Tax=Pseudoalteromonas lipolytica TaxID=570156 RepID=A0ABY1GSV9_9GAMM|nr:hypothetical protein [Pseudoalteromonas lipolytica]MBE0349641.1 hypothetical protein [Pseudoalteromonas lipolytica LMEB 39]SFT78442.1 hypothetical protein SAMN04487854_109204 [Pseudoalteromonas lipolytica]
MEKSKILFLWLNDREFHAQNAEKRGVDVSQVYKNHSKILKAFRRLIIKFPVITIRPWLNSKWVKKLKKYNTIIIHASKLTPPVVAFINKEHPDARVIVWYWNPIIKTIALDAFSHLNCEVWTFDEKDSEEYNIPHNTQYYFSNCHFAALNKRLDNDIFFVGGDKGRLDYLIKAKESFISAGARVFFNITNTAKVKVKNDIYQDRMSYDDVVHKILQSRAILDVVSQNQSGLTLRPLESIFYERKLITNDKSIIERDFYRKENIFILEHDEVSNINEFINSPYKPLPKELVNKYDFDAWLARFFM